MSNYRIIEIMDEYSIIINYGRKDGAKENESVRIYAIGPEVKDPTTGTVLGTLDAIKARLSIITVYDHFSICRKVETKVSNVLMSPMSQFQTTTKMAVRLNVRKEDISSKQPPQDDEIKVGDLVKIV